MEHQLESLFQEWHRLGGNVLVQQVDTTLPARDAEQVIASSTRYCRDSSRLMWVVLGWFVDHVDQIEVEQLLNETRTSGELSVLGLLCDAAYLKNPNPKFIQIMMQCVKPPQLEPFFTRVAKSRLALKLASENPIDVFLRWNYLSNELSYA